MFFFSSRRRHTRWPRDWSSDVCSSDLTAHFWKESNMGLLQEHGRDLDMDWSMHLRLLSETGISFPKFSRGPPLWSWIPESAISAWPVLQFFRHFQQGLNHSTTRRISE